ncbi:hypothetical protein KIW84_025450 [Lathyrus oleraceus]|uniref:Reverse transcriptase domain-containing protein n=1 Tax=Pisum sativum TaxID=3888 RepID=A0A9D4YIE0_PEA|nr:hypothetical protein KIW84_025450 [Pisum sativum]
MAAQNRHFEEETRNNQKNTTTPLMNLEVQLGQIAQQLASSRTPGSLPSETVQNPKGQENISTVTMKKKKAAKNKNKIISSGEPTDEESTKETNRDTKINLKFADHSRKDAYGIAEDVLVIIEDLIFPVDFVILDIPEDDEAPIILGRPFMQASRCNLDMDQGTLTLKAHDKEIKLNAIENQKLEEDT